MRFALVVTTLLFYGLVFLIWYYSWWKAGPETSSLLVVEGNQELEGLSVIVDGPTLPYPFRATIAAKAGYVCRFPLSKGDYWIRFERDGKRLYEEPFSLPPHLYVLISLDKIQQKLKG